VSGAFGKSIQHPTASRPIGIVLSPLLNLAPCADTGPRVNQHRPILALGPEGLRGSVMLSLAPDRRTIEARARFDRPAAMRLRRIEGPKPSGPGVENSEDLLLLAFYAATPGDSRVMGGATFPLCDRQVYEPLDPLSALGEIDFRWSELRACSIDGMAVEPARRTRPAVRDEADYWKRRMLVEIGAAERSLSAVAACRHVELANLYARHLRDGRESV